MIKKIIFWHFSSQSETSQSDSQCSLGINPKQHSKAGSGLIFQLFLFIGNYFEFYGNEFSSCGFSVV